MTIRGDEKVGLVYESAPHMKSIERPQGMMFEATDGLFEGILGEVAEIGVRKVGLQGRFEAPIVLRGKLALAHQPSTESRLARAPRGH